MQSRKQITPEKAYQLAVRLVSLNGLPHEWFNRFFAGVQAQIRDESTDAFAVAFDLLSEAAQHLLYWDADYAAQYTGGERQYIFDVCGWRDENETGITYRTQFTADRYVEVTHDGSGKFFVEARTATGRPSRYFKELLGDVLPELCNFETN